MKRSYYLLYLLLLPFLGSAQIIVTSTASSGPGTLRQAILDANADPAEDNIFFNINGGGAATITLSTALPNILDDGIIIDATTQPGHIDSPLITLDGNGLPVTGIAVFADFCAISGLKIINFGLYGVSAADCEQLSIFDNIITENVTNQILLSTASNCSIVRNILNIDENGTASSIDARGIRLQLGSTQNFILENTIGGLNNINNPLILISEVESESNIVEDNFIGTNANGDNYGSSFQVGIVLYAARINDIISNVIAFNNIGISNTFGAQDNLFTNNNFSCNINNGIFNEPGSNGNIQPPVFTQATNVQVTGTANPFSTIEIYLQSDLDCPGTACQGNIFGNVSTDINGDWTFIPTGLPLGSVITAIQIEQNLSANTSEFAACATIVEPCDLDTEGPVFSGIPMNITISCNDPYPNTTALFANITAFDAFEGDVSGEIFVIPPGVVVGCIPAPSRTDEFLFTVADACGNGTVETFTITILNDLTVDLGPDRAICDGVVVTLDAGTPGSIYEWSTGETTQTIDVSFANTYSVTITGGNLCCAIDEIVITTGSVPNVSATGGVLDCSNNPLQLTANSTTPGVTYLWTDPTGVTIDLQNPIVSLGGVFTLEVTAPNTCTSSTTVTVLDERTDTGNPVISGIPMNVTIGCNDPYPNTTALLANVTAFDAVDGDLTGDIFVIPPGFVVGCLPAPSRDEEYIFSVSDACGNTTEEIFTITITNDLTVDLGPDRAICDGVPVTLDAGNPGLEYEWSTGETTQTIEVIFEDTYSVTITGGNLCCAIDEVVMSLGAPPNVSATGGVLDCFNNPLQLTANSTTFGVTYLWTDPNGVTTYLQNPTVSLGGIHTLEVTAPNACTTSTTVTVTDFRTDIEAPIISSIPMDVTIGCNDPYPNTTALFANITAFDAVDGDLTGDISVIPPGFVFGCVPAPSRAEEYIFSVLDACGNMTEEIFTITITNDVTVDLGPDLFLCNNEVILLNAGNVGLEYEWSTGETTQMIFVNSVDTYSVTVTGGNLCCAVDEISIINHNNTLPPVITGVPNNITIECGDPEPAFPVVGVDIFATDGNGLDITADIIGGGVIEVGDCFEIQTFTFFVQDACGQQAAATYIITIIDTQLPVFLGIPMDITIGCNDPYPNTAAIIANITAFDDCDGDLTGDISIIPPGFVVGCLPAPNRTDEYLFSVEDACGNIADATFTITILNDVTVNLGPDQFLCNNENVLLDAGNPGLAYEWSTGETTQTITVNTTNTYSVTVTGGNLCCAIDEVIISAGTAPNLSATGGTITCTNPSITLMANSTTAGVTYLWTDPNGLT
ncbi:MAG: hypothetical protein ACI9XB_004592, partial [Gammaproteobacteria bacterium]